MSISFRSYSLLNTSDVASYAISDGMLDRRTPDDQGLVDTASLTIICQPMQVNVAIPFP